MKKLQLKKEVVAALNDDQMNQVKGGGSADCPPPKTFDIMCEERPITQMTFCNCPSVDIICI
ncbi:class I lanthipeptide [uncultured Alistipes sp.]|jgi:hypothetical protein|uniref:class I lanthipeptide n=1 Tax=uncultured Alistipes sp. TaxID=538949 RepID=UPI0025EAC8D5|nr:class I lanthipeptide [uncultured Alistipes sp.]